MKKALKPADQKEQVEKLRYDYDVSIHRACSVISMHRSNYYYKAKKDDQLALRLRINEIASTRIRYGYQRIYILLRLEGWVINHKRALRLYKIERLNLRQKKPKLRVSAANRILSPALTSKDECWSMDFVADQLSNRRRIMALTIVDNYSRECLNITVDHSLK